LLLRIGLGNVPGNEIKNWLPKNKKSPAARRPPGGMETSEVAKAPLLYLTSSLN
jgi:hypothetical protein